MNIPFIKIHGNGNDFVLIEDLNDTRNLATEQIKFICERRFGVGADGLLLIKSSSNGFDFKMIYYNSDGNRVDFCGNGGRCITKAASLSLQKNDLVFEADDGIHKGYVEGDEMVAISMSRAEMIKHGSCVDSLIVSLEIPVSDYVLLDTGVPHLVLKLQMEENDFAQIPVVEMGKSIRYSECFREHGINVNFVIVGENGIIKQRTYERGVEDETLSCGTGSVAIAKYLQDITGDNVFKINTPGGVNQVTFSQENEPLLSGKVKIVYSGNINL